MSSRADDFDVRHRDGRDGRGWGDGAYGGQAGNDQGGFSGATVDYDLGYDDTGFDTQGFRSPTAGYAGQQETGYPGHTGVGTAPRRGNGRGGSHARSSGGPQATQAFQGPMGPGVPTGPMGPGGPTGPGGPMGPGRRGPRRRDGSAGAAKVKGSWWRHWTVRKALGVLLACVGGVVVLGAIAVVLTYENTPVPSAAMAATGYSQTTVVSSNGTLIGRFGTTDRVDLTYNQFPKPLIYAVLAAEDRSFFTEGGISPTGILRAAYEDLKGNDGSLQGGSTITQEFVRQYYVGIGTEQTLSRKLKEIFVAMKVAKEKSKQWILTNYLNTIYFGQGSYGVQAAAETYFDKPVWKLSVAQDAVIAAVIQQPSTYPLAQYRPELVARWHYVLDGMVTTGHLTAQQAAAMKFPAPGDHVPQTVGKDVWDPYILNMVYNELVDVYDFSQSQIYNGGYLIKTTIDDAKMEALYQAVQQNEVQMADDGGALQSYMHVGAVLENPATGAIEALYPGPGYPGSRYVDAYGETHTMTVKECKILDCEVNMAVYNREQVGSSFKPYILSTAVQEGMNVQTSTLDGYDNLCIPLDTQPSTYAAAGVVDPATGKLECQESGWYPVTNDDTSENGPYTPQNAMAQSINTAYTDLWHKDGGDAVLNMAKSMGVNIVTSGLEEMENEAGVALGQASLTVAEQATMLATIDDNGVYHQAHVISSITQNGMPTPIKVSTALVFSANPTLNAEEASQVQYAMSKTTVDGTATVAAMSDGREIIGKTGTTNTAQSAFFIGAIPQEALAVGMFTNEQNGATNGESLNNLGGQQQGGFGGTWPATIWHTYAEDMFAQLPIQQFQTPVFTGQAWNMVPPGLRQVAKKQPKKNHNNQSQNPTPNPFSTPTPQPNPGNPQPFPTYSCDPQVVTCEPNSPAQQNDGGST